MEQTTFFDHYRVCTNHDGTPAEVSRTGAAINYKAIDTNSKETVALQIIPTATVDLAKRAEFEERARTAQKLDHVNIAKLLAVETDRDHIGLISESVEGETVEAWMFAHGPMPADAVLRIGLQVVRALGAAAFHGLTHRGIQPSNLVIVPGQTADGGWPFVKLLNFGLAGSEIYSSGDPARELAPSAGAQFASPEQLMDRPLDFRSEMYSLGATMCFLLTGAVPLAVSGMKARLRARRLPELRRAPKALRNLLTHMLRENPENRPQDPVAFETEIRDCLTKVERRQALGRRFGIPLAAVIPRKAKTPRTPATPLAQVFRGAIAFVGLMLAAVVLGAFLLPEDAVPFWRHSTASNEIGVPVGVPTSDTAPVALAKNATPVQQTMSAPSSPAPVVAKAAAINPPAPIAGPDATASPNAQQAQVASIPTANPDPQAAPQIASNLSASEPAPPAEGPDIEPAAAPNSDEQKQISALTNSDASVAAAPNQSDASDNKVAETSNSVAASSSSSKTKPTIAKSTRTSTSKRGRIAQNSPNEIGQPHLQRGVVRARFVGMTPDGRVILRLPSGRIVTSALPSEGGSPRRRVRIEHREESAPVPYQPFDPDYPFGN